MSSRFIILIRHEKTELSSGKRFIGQCDVGLSDEGLSDSEKLGEALKGYLFGYLFSSGLKRSMQTAEIIAKHTGLTPHIVPDLSEINLGDWDGRYIEDIKKECPDEYLKRGNDMIRYRPPGGENFLDLEKRALKAFHGIINNKGNLIVVSHTSVNRVIIGSVFRMSLGKALSIPQDYGCCNVLEQTDSKMRVRLVNGAIEDIGAWMAQG